MQKGIIPITLTVSSLFLFCAMCPTQSAPISYATWLIGTWENKTPKGSIYETWTRDTNYALTASSYKLTDKDSIVLENVRLVQENNTLFYIPTVRNQNDGLPVRFSLQYISDKEMVFENKKHDFPQVIRYSKITTDSLVAEISGISNGKERKATFPMKRLK